MGSFWARLLGVERRCERDRRTIQTLLQRITALEQQLAQLRGAV